MKRFRLAAALLPLALFAVGCAGIEGEDVDESAADLSAGDDAIVSVDGLNLRAGPSTDDDVVTVMPEGSRVHVTGGAKAGFVPVTFDGKKGWAFEEYLSIAGKPPAVDVTSLPKAVAALAAEAPKRSPGTELGIAVMNLTTGEYAGAGDEVRHVSASSAKVIWVAAAMHAGGTVSDIAPGIFESSDNALAGVAIDRAGGIDEVNDFYWHVADMDHSITANWSIGKPRHASNQGQMGGDNYFTPHDVIGFLSKLDRREILSKSATATLENYMTMSPRSGYGGWLGTLLPPAAREQMMHKAGWLPPPDYSEYSTLNEVGLVQVPGGDRYAIALLAHHGRDYGKEASMVERASCVVYRTIAHDKTLGCRD
ncbi:MAG: serine hydrolase [Labilithrix sp.]